MIQDLHSHTNYSYCGSDSPDTVVETAIAGGIDMLGICDHNYGVTRQTPDGVYSSEAERVSECQRLLDDYLAQLRGLSERYSSQIKIVCGLEIATVNEKWRLLPDRVDLSGFDYCMIEHIDTDITVVDDIFAYAARCATGRVGIAHTDIFSFLSRTGRDAGSFFRRMAENGIFWELNVNYDSIHGYREHEYVADFFADGRKQEIFLESGAEISVGFDGHRVGDYRPDRVRDACEKLERGGFRLAFGS